MLEQVIKTGKKHTFSFEERKQLNLELMKNSAESIKQIKEKRLRNISLMNKANTIILD